MSLEVLAGFGFDFSRATFDHRVMKWLIRGRRMCMGIRAKWKFLQGGGEVKQPGWK